MRGGLSPKKKKRKSESGWKGQFTKYGLRRALGGLRKRLRLTKYHVVLSGMGAHFLV